MCENVKKNPGSVPKVNGVYTEPRPVFHLSFMEILGRITFHSCTVLLKVKLCAVFLYLISH